MNCTAAQRLISAERDGALGNPGQAGLEAHLAGCPGCRRFRQSLADAAVAWRATTGAVPAPDAALEWQRLQRRLAPTVRPAARRQSRLWWSLSFATAAALAVAIWMPGRVPVAQADWVEVGEGTASATVYVDEQSGWLVVWAVGDAERS